MNHFQKSEGILQKELLYHLLRGLSVVSTNLKRFPEEIQLSTAEFSFSTKKVTNRKGGISAFVGFETSKVKEYISEETSTFDFSRSRPIRNHPKKFKWKELGMNFQLTFAGEIMREIADEIIISRATGIPVSSIVVKKSYSVTNTTAGTLGLKLFEELVEISAKVERAKTVSHSFTITFSPKKSKDKKELGIIAKR